MPTKRMTIQMRFEYLKLMQERYRRCGKAARGELLDEMQQMTGLHRKTLIQRMAGDMRRRPRRKQRGRRYGIEVDDALRVIAESLDYIAAERLQPSLVPLARRLAAHRELSLSTRLEQDLAHISVSTVRRVLRRVGQADARRLPRKRGHASPLTQGIPMRRIPWDESEPGHFETDLVHHCGYSAAGDYVHTLQLIDVTTGWSERVAVLGRSYCVMADAFQRILRRLPFVVREIHPDNGSEFFNHHLLRFWGQQVTGIRLSRSRPWQKNDNRFVEQKNNTLVRNFLGTERLDSVAQTHLLNQLYERMWVFYNLFQPVMRLKEKTYLRNSDGTHRLQRRFDMAQTPFDRLCAADAITPQERQRLEQLRDQTNPRELRREIYDLLDKLFKTPGATPGVTEDVHLTLSVPSSPQKGAAIPVTLSVG
jgi:IS30 family transposase